MGERASLLSALPTCTLPYLECGRSDVSKMAPRTPLPNSSSSSWSLDPDPPFAGIQVASCSRSALQVSIPRELPLAEVRRHVAASHDFALFPYFRPHCRTGRIPLFHGGTRGQPPRRRVLVTRTSSRVVVLFLVAALVALPGFAATHAPQAKKPGGLMSAVVQLLHGLFPGLEKAHGSMDPDGQPAPTSGSAPTSDAQGTMDPNGNT